MKFKYFTIEEFNCQETGENEMSAEFIYKLDQLREACGFPFKITSGYRSPSHSIEARRQSQVLMPRELLVIYMYLVAHNAILLLKKLCD